MDLETLMLDLQRLEFNIRRSPHFEGDYPDVFIKLGNQTIEITNISVKDGTVLVEGI